MTKCNKCDKEAEFDSPEMLCHRHWTEWWVEGWPFASEEEREATIKELMESRDEPEEEPTV